MDSVAGLPREMASSMAHSMPAITPAEEPLPPHERTCTVTMVTSFAMPYVVPPMVEAQCVPCPLHVESSAVITPCGR